MLPLHFQLCQHQSRWSFARKSAILTQHIFIFSLQDQTILLYPSLKGHYCRIQQTMDSLVSCLQNSFSTRHLYSPDQSREPGSLLLTRPDNWGMAQLAHLRWWLACCTHWKCCRCPPWQPQSLSLSPPFFSQWYQLSCTIFWEYQLFLLYIGE